ncbi:MAG: hypothetical protein ACK5QH_12900 [Rubrivivax sp.]
MNPLAALEATPGMGHAPSATLQALNDALAAAWAEPAQAPAAHLPVADAPVALPNVGDTQASSPGALAPLATAPSTLLHSAGAVHAAAPPPGSEGPAALGTQDTAGLAWAPLAIHGAGPARSDSPDAPSLPGHHRALQLGGQPPTDPTAHPAASPGWAPLRREPDAVDSGAEGDAQPQGQEHGTDTPDGAPVPAWPADSATQAQAWCARLQAAAQQAALDELARGRAVLLVGAGQAWCLQRQRVASFSSRASGPPPRAWQAWRLFRQGQAGPRSAWQARQPDGGCQLHLGRHLPTLAGGRHWAVAEAHRLQQALGNQWSLLLLALPESGDAPAHDTAPSAQPAHPAWPSELHHGMD